MSLDDDLTGLFLRCFVTPIGSIDPNKGRMKRT